MGKRNAKRCVALLAAAVFLSAFGAFAPTGERSKQVFADQEEVAVNHDIKAGDVTLVNEETDLTVAVASGTTENYLPSSKLWNGISTVMTSGGNIFVAWYTGGTKEPHVHNYINVAASDDGGETWRNPYMIVDPLDESESCVVPMFYRNAEDEIVLCWQQAGGLHGLKLLRPDGALDAVGYTQPVAMNGVTMFNKPLKLTDGRYLYATGASVSSVYESTDGGNTFLQGVEIKSEAESPNKLFTEAVIVEKQDGVLWYLSRLEKNYNGGMEQSYSYDGGETWEISCGNLPEPLTGPGSRFNLQRLKSGALLFVGNKGGMGVLRTKLTAYLSYDDGESWPYSLELDPLESSYPDFYEDEEGRIFIAYDKERYGEGGIRLSVVTEEDIKAGDFVTAAARDKCVITKMNYDYSDIKSVNGAYPEVAYYSVGTELSEILAAFPTTVSVTDDNGKTIRLKGKYRVSGYNKDVAGKYMAYFIPDTQPTGLKDSFNKFRFAIVLEEGGCGSALGAPAAFGSVAFAGAGLALFAGLKNKKQRGGKEND